MRLAYALATAWQAVVYTLYVHVQFTSLHTSERCLDEGHSVFTFTFNPVAQPDSADSRGGVYHRRCCPHWQALAGQDGGASGQVRRLGSLPLSLGLKETRWLSRVGALPPPAQWAAGEEEGTYAAGQSPATVVHRHEGLGRAGEGGGSGAADGENHEELCAEVSACVCIQCIYTMQASSSLFSVLRVYVRPSLIFPLLSECSIPRPMSASPPITSHKTSSTSSPTSLTTSTTRLPLHTHTHPLPPPPPPPPHHHPLTTSLPHTLTTRGRPSSAYCARDKSSSRNKECSYSRSM